MAMTSVSGHLMTTDFPGSYRGWNNVDPEELFDAQIIKMVPDNFKNIKVSIIYLCCHLTLYVLNNNIV